ncbi:MAG: TerB family tellurite resistance protein [Mariprofundaceae bacterium]
MITRLKNLFGETSDDKRHEHDIALAVAALMIEVMLMDGRLDDAEHNIITHLLKKRFELADDEIETLIKRATLEADKAHDLYQFTSRIIKEYPIGERSDIIRELWRIAMADGHADAYEEQLIRRIAELIGVHHHQFIDAKIQAREAT